MTEREEFDLLVSAPHKDCQSVYHGGCACLGDCLGHQLAKLRRKYDANYAGTERWWSDQLHGTLLVRPGDTGCKGEPLTAWNYWTGTATPREW